MLTVTTEGPVARVTLERPAVHNALDDVLIARLTTTFDELGRREAIRVIVLAAAGPSFSAGADINYMRRLAAQSKAENIKDAQSVARMFLTIATCPRPVLARVHGRALGGGVGLVAACDMAVALEAAEFGFSEVKLGIIPATIAPFVIARIGPARAREYFLTGERFSASTAAAIGLVRQVAPAEASMDAWIASRISEILTAAPGAVARTKDLIFRIAGPSFESLVDVTATAIAEARASDEGQAGMKAFLDRSKPPWSGA